MNSYKKSAIILLFVLVGLYFVISVVTLGVSFKYALDAKGTAGLVQESFESHNYERSLEYLIELEKELDSAHKWQTPSGWVRIVPVFRHDYVVYSELINAGSLLTSSVTSIVSHLTQSNISTQISFESLDLRTAGQAYLSVHDDVLEAIDHLIVASAQAEQLHIDLIPEQYQSSILGLQDFLKTYNQKLVLYRPHLEILPNILGKYDAHEILVLLQNSHELRPTGGFIGNYSRVSIENGMLTNFFTDDVYNVDVQALGREIHVPPEPVKEYMGVEHWYFRDSNWSPDYPTSAKDVKELYEYQTEEEGINTVIALTPYIVQEFFKIVGPIQVEDLVFTSENFIDVLQYRVEYEYWRLGQTREERKEIIRHLAEVLKQRFFTMEKSELLAFLDVVESAFTQNEILVYSTNPQYQEIVNQLDWDGAIVNADADYLYVVDANVAALKTDRVMDRTHNYTLTQDEDGRWKAMLKLEYKNNGTFDYRTTRYRSYTRIYVPLGSELISSTGFTQTDKSNVYVDPMVHSEFDKTVFAGFISVEPGQKRYVQLEYYLPQRLAEKINDSGKYELFVQKQPGAQNTQIIADISAPNQVHSFSPSNVEYKVLGDTQLTFIDFLSKDIQYTLVFK